MRVSKIEHCVDCNKEFPRKELNRRHRCQDCRIIIVRDNMSQLMAHSGPQYEKWKQGVRAAAEKL
ncbi:hypothetical protein ES703_56499 [subsurface metagenome]